MASNGSTEVKPEDSGKPRRNDSNKGEPTTSDRAVAGPPSGDSGQKGEGDKPGKGTGRKGKPRPWKIKKKASESAESSAAKNTTGSSSIVISYKGRYKGSSPTVRAASHNLEFSQFIILVREVYRVITAVDQSVQDRCPFPVFQHVCCMFLNAYLCDFAGRELRIGVCTTEIPLLTQLRASEFLLPTPIYDFIAGIGNSVSPADEIIHVNIPTVAIPQGPIAVEDREAAIEAGTFGEVTVENHNVYECYIAPAVTARYIESTVVNNEAPVFDAAWDPLPPALAPDHATPTANLLGYWPVERQSPEAMSVLQACVFKNDAYMLGRIRYSRAALEIFGLTLSGMKDSLELRFADFQFQETQSVFIYKTPYPEGININPVHRLVNYSALLQSPYAFGASAANRAHLYGYKRQRGLNSSGPCYVIGDANDIPGGWVATSNYNFTQHEPFAPSEQLEEYETMRFAGHHEINTAGRITQDVNLWLSRNTVKLK